MHTVEIAHTYGKLLDKQTFFLSFFRGSQQAYHDIGVPTDCNWLSVLNLPSQNHWGIRVTFRISSRFLYSNPPDRDYITAGCQQELAFDLRVCSGNLTRQLKTFQISRIELWGICSRAVCEVLDDLPSRCHLFAWHSLLCVSNVSESGGAELGLDFIGWFSSLGHLQSVSWNLQHNWGGAVFAQVLAKTCRDGAVQAMLSRTNWWDLCGQTNAAGRTTSSTSVFSVPTIWRFEVSGVG